MTDINQTIKRLETEALGIDAYLEKDYRYSIEEKAVSAVDYDGAVGDFIRGYKIYSNTKMSNKVAISIYVNHLDLLINGMYSLSFTLKNRDPDEASTIIKSILDYLSNEGFTEIIYYFRGTIVKRIASINSAILEKASYSKLSYGLTPRFLATSKVQSVVLF